ncbi:MAG: prepilin-type N-terminal cleavage/methylation domain-containing protein [Actinomycetes bacterium]
MRRYQSGFTLVETIIGVSVLVVFMGAATLALMTTLKLNVMTNASLSNSSSTELTVAYFNDDVQDASTIRVTGTPNCQASPAQSDTLVVELVGSSFDAAAQPLSRMFVISYVTRTVTVNGAALVQMHRLTCNWVAPTPTSTQPAFPWAAEGDTELSTLDSSTDASLYVAPVVTCRPRAVVTPTSSLCADPAWALASIEITPVGGPADKYSVSGSRRTS